MAKVAAVASAIGIPQELGLDIICSACCANPDLAPDKRSKKIASHDEAISHWVEKFYKGYLGRPSAKTGQAPATIPDPVISEIICAVLSHLSDTDISKVVYAHRLAMSAENLVGPFVEEYVFDTLKTHGWALAWGESVRAVDLCGRGGQLIQIKNRSNTENSSSRKVREGTPISKWFRVDAVSGEYLWDELCAMTGVSKGTLSESGFRAFVKNALVANPDSLGLDADNPWRHPQSPNIS